MFIQYITNITNITKHSSNDSYITFFPAGYGLFTKQRIEAGSYICTYTRGPLITEESAQERVKLPDADYFYFFPYEGNTLWYVSNFMTVYSGIMNALIRS